MRFRITYYIYYIRDYISKHIHQCSHHYNIFSYQIVQHKIIKMDYDCATPQVSRVSVSNIVTRHLYLYYIIMISWMLYVHTPQSSSYIKDISHTVRVTSTICSIPITLGIISNIFQDNYRITLNIYNYIIMIGILLWYIYDIQSNLITTILYQF